MPWQAHLFIGERVHDVDDIQRIANVLGMDIELSGEENDWFEINEAWDAASSPQFTIRYDNKDFSSTPACWKEHEGGTPFPVPRGDKYTDAIIGFELTSRYSGSILDHKEPHGRPEPYEIDLDGAKEILDEVRKKWPSAQVLIWDTWH